MTERPPSYHRARQERADRAARLEAADLRNVAVLEIDGIDALQNRPFPRQLAIAYADGRPSRAWIIAPEQLWNLSGGEMSAWGVERGTIGSHPEVAANEVLAAMGRCRVYARSPDDTNRWLALFFRTGRRGDDWFRIRDLRELTSPPGTSMYDLPSAEVRRAEREAATLHSDANHASRDAARAVQYVKAVVAIRRDRDETLALEAEEKRGATAQEFGMSA